MATGSDSLFWFQWHFHFDIVVGVLLLEAAYLLGVGPLRRRYGLADAAPSRHVLFFSMGVFLLFVTLTSPIHHLADEFLFSAHMVQHVLLLLVIPPLLLAGTPTWLLRPLIRGPIVLAAGRFLTHPFVAFAIFTIVLSLWHIPALYDLALRNEAAHIMQHLFFISSAIVMWWPVLSPLSALPRASYPVQMVYLFSLTIPMGFIGAAITFSQRVLYTWYDTVPRLWGLPVISDQQIGGLIMKIPGALAFMGVMAVVFFKWYNHDQNMKGDTRREFAPLTEDTSSSRSASNDNGVTLFRR